MANKAPKSFPINHDDYHAKHIGRTADGRQFFLTTPLVPASKDAPGCEFIALFIFDAKGSLLEATIDSLGPRATVDREAARKKCEQRLSELGDVKFQRIKIAPFEINRFDTQFGLIARPPEPEDEDWAVELQPGNYMAFFPPWDGDYDT